MAMKVGELEQQRYFSQEQIMEEKFTQEQIDALIVRPATYAELQKMRHVVMSRHSTTYARRQKAA